MKVTRYLLSPALFAGLALAFSACADSEDPPSSDSAADSQGPSGGADNGSDKSSTGGGDSDPDPAPKIDCSKLKSTGVKVGEIPPNVTLKDADGKDVSLYDHCNSIIYVIAGTAG